MLAVDDWAQRGINRLRGRAESPGNAAAEDVAELALDVGVETRIIAAHGDLGEEHLQAIAGDRVDEVPRAGSGAWPETREESALPQRTGRVINRARRETRRR